MRILLAISIAMLVSCTSIVPLDRTVSIENIEKESNGTILYNQELFSGKVVEYYSNGEMASSTKYWRGIKDGVEYNFFPDGSLKSRRYYRNGEKHGVHRGYFEDGSLRFVYRFKKGLSVGNHKVWYEDGQLAQDLNYANGYPFGSQKVWRRDGKIRSNYVVREDGRRYGLVGIKRCKNIDIEEEKVAPLTAQNYVQ